MKPRRRLQRRLLAAFAALTLGVAGLFAFYAIAFVYMVEDRFFVAQLHDEAAYLRQAQAASGRWPAPRAAHLTLHTDSAGLPSDLRVPFLAEPGRSEFPGRDGRHYHLLALNGNDGRPAWLVAEVGDRLVVRPMRRHIFALLAWSGAIVLALALLLGAWIAHRSSRPLAELADVVAGLQPGELPERLPATRGDDEIGTLTRGLEALIGRVRTFVAREQEFTRDASHELRTPLAVIRSAGERLAAEADLDAAQRRHLDHIRLSAAQLEQTVTTLLALAREQPLAAAGPTRLLPLIERVIVEQAPLIGDRPIRVDLDVAPAAATPQPAAVLHIVLSNLIGNAFAHTERGSVRIDLADGTLRIANRGHAIDDALRAALHQPFTKREGSAGFGLGLAIVQRLCDRHGIALAIVHDADGTQARIGLGA
ncbi:MAG TPA: HAMP domain-containing sensor histidine kinase [Dokdonella sp.]|uniref:sensor histidine kinase n=1 Tax=Dokdonella sp. TaxID=2291710 RepID=UPI002CDAD404|nr:HAMP domain-containing sensor histidine kinase [Dokdonella sp.]HUD40831.1 HAMP domain-containing sensor histidine kinase [Dokdonella sp.]